MFQGVSPESYAQNPLRLWYQQPAKTWEACVPLGNGRLGAMPDGGVFNENIVLNDITLWSGGPQDADEPGAVQYLPQIRQLLFAGKNDEAEALINRVFVCRGKGSGSGDGANAPYGSYQVLGNMHLAYAYGDKPAVGEALDYTRELFLDSALAKCQFRIGEVTYRREYFTSFTGDVVIIRLSADKPGKVSLTLSLDRPERYTTAVNGQELDMSGRLTNGTDGNGMRYLARVRMLPEGGQLLAGDTSLQVKDANSVVIYISAGTDFWSPGYGGRSALMLRRAMSKPYRVEKAAHISAYRKLFSRASLSLDAGGLPGAAANGRAAALPTDERLQAFTRDSSDNGLPVLYFQYGRYLLISSTRPGLLPPNLQGLWANSIRTPWNGDYHLDINVQMNHWPLEVTNLPMLNEPFYSLVNGLVAPGEKTAQAYYNGKGWVAHAITNIWGYTSPGEDASWGATNSGSGWLCQVLWEHYAFTRDSAYLRRIYPILKGSAEFYLSTMVRDPDKGWLVTAPSNSPENAFRLPDGKTAHVCVAPTIDNEIIGELFRDVVEAGERLRIDAEFRQRVAAAAGLLPPDQVARDGRLQEWLKDYPEVEPHHRHVSHLWGLYPGTEISPAGEPALARAAAASLEGRGDMGTGWSLAWKMNLWARLGEGDRAFRLLQDLLRPTGATAVNMVDGGGTYPNLFCGHPPFQIDGNFGGCAGIAEMLLQSNAGYIELLPAIPDVWKDGSFTGLCARGGAVVSARWKDHRITTVGITATATGHVRLKTPAGDVIDLPMRRGQHVDMDLTPHRYDIIPYPSSLVPKAGGFVITTQTKLALPGDGAVFGNEAAYLRQMIRKSLGPGALRQDDRAVSGAIILRHDPSVTSAEGYALSVDSSRVVLRAAGPAGMFHALETLRQLLPADVEGGAVVGAGGTTAAAKARVLSVPAVEIADRPAFAWRGMMLDVSRHFFSVAYVKKYIDMMALYKFSRLHLHLTDDQGWRIEIKKYPRLTAEGAWRSFNKQDSANMEMAKKTGNPDFDLDSSHFRYRNGRTEYGGFYTQEEMKGIIRYAASRHIEIVPEIDMPGHMMAAAALYPWLTCDGTVGADGSRGFSNPICPCKDSAMQFAKDVFSEIIDLFPSPYIHIGGDEVEKKDWERSPLVHAFMARHRIGTLDQLQSYFNDQLQAFFRSRGKTLVGWDEIVEGGIDSSAVVMFWRPWASQSPLRATRNGNKVVMTPDGPLYFDAWPDRNTLDAVYHYKPFDSAYGMNKAQEANILGVQGNLWTEMVPTENRADYLTMPRMTALAELGWTHKDLYASYLERLEGQYARLDLLGIHYRLSDLPELADTHVFTDTASFFIPAPSPRLTLRYTDDGTNPVPASPILSRALRIDHSMTLKIAAFTASGRRGDINTLAFDRQACAVPVAAEHAVPGLECRFFKGYFDLTTKIPEAPDSVLWVGQAEVPPGIATPEFGLKFRGYIDVPETGIYSFFLTSNDGSVLRIADRLVVDNDGLHSDREKSGQVALEKGLHPFALDFAEAGGGYSLDLKYSVGGGQPRSIPADWFKR